MTPDQWDKVVFWFCVFGWIYVTYLTATGAV
jgi:hypothetical protein